MRVLSRFSLLLIVLLIFGCREDKPSTSQKPETKPTKPPVVKKHVKVPPFDAQKAYSHIQAQVDFGPRVPGTPAHEKTKNWMIRQLEAVGLKPVQQEFDAFLPDGTKYRATNLIASYNPGSKRRILLAAHWDSRYLADHDPKVKNKPVPGADDGASGVGVLLTIAGILRDNPADVGVDFLFLDAEDQGFPEGQNKDDDGTSWCQGSQYWSARTGLPYKPEFGILLDMVGAKNAQFYIEEVSLNYAGAYAKKVWSMAKGMGYSQYFMDGVLPAIIDDHLFINRIARIPTLDIINRFPKNGDYVFGEHWHTVHDDMQVIDKNTLRAVGQTVTAVIYQYSGGRF